MSLHVTACPRNCYSTCGLEVEVQDGRIRRILPLTSNKATSHGPCLKGLSYFEIVDAPDRILYPLIRTGENGTFKRVSWDEALGIITDKLKNFRQKYGAQSVLYYAGSGTKGLLNEVGINFWRLFGGCTTTYGDLCWPAGLEATRLTLGDNIHNAPWDISNAKLIVLWGKNTAETNIQQMSFLDEALEAEGKLVVIDPRRTESAERAELLIQPRPGTDGALALGIAHLIVKNGNVDTKFVEDHVLGYPEFAESVKDFTPEKAAGITDVPVSQIKRLADLIGTVKPLTINAGFGMQRYSNSGQSVRAIITLLALTGNIGKPGAGWIYANLATQIFGERDPLAVYPPEQVDDKIRVSISTALLGSGIREAENPPIKMTWVERGNPIPQNPGTHDIIAAFRALDFRVVVDRFMTDTAREADIILPAKTMFEQTDVIGAYWHSYIQLKQKIIEPPGEVKPESEIYRLLAQRLGISDSEIDSFIPGTSDADVEEFLEEKLEPFPELSLEKLKEGPVLAPGSSGIAFEGLHFPTPSGKIEILSREAEERWKIGSLPGYSEPVESVRPDSGENAKYPLYLLTPNTKNRIHSQFGNLPSIRKLDEKPILSISHIDANERGISDGEVIRLFNDRGELHIEARIDFGIKPGCVSVTNGWWIEEGGAVNLLSQARETDIGYGAAFHENLVDVEKVR